MDLLILAGILQFLEGFIESINELLFPLRCRDSVKITLFRGSNGLCVGSAALFKELLQYRQVTDNGVHIAVFKFQAGKVRRVKIRDLGTFNLFGFLGARSA